MVDLRDHAVLTERRRQLERFFAALAVHTRDIHGGFFRLGNDHARLLHHHQKPLDTSREAHSRCGFTADLLEESVISPPAAHGALRADGSGRELEHGTVVIVQPTHDTRVNFIAHARQIQAGFHFLKVRFARLAKVVKNLGRVLVDRLAAFLFAVEKAERIFLKTGLTIPAEAPKVGFKKRFKRFVILRAAGRTADGVDVQLHLKPQLFQKGIRHENGFRVRLRARGAVHFHPEWVEFAKSARLRSFIAERRNDVVHFRRQNAAAHAVFDKRTPNARRTVGF